MNDLLDSFRRLVGIVEAHDARDRDKLVKAIHALYYGGIPTVRRGRAELKRLIRTDYRSLWEKGKRSLGELQKEADVMERALRRIRGMAERPECLCGRPTGTGAIRACADKALRSSDVTQKGDKA